MESITKCLQTVILRPLPAVDLSPLPDKPQGKLKLTPEAWLNAIQGQQRMSYRSLLNTS